MTADETPRPYFVHRFSNVGGGRARMLVAHAPGGIEGFYRAAGKPAGEAEPGQEPIPDKAHYKEAAAQHEMRVVAWRDEDLSAPR